MSSSTSTTSSSSGPKSAAECRKFSPNIFNRSKCQHCFASKEAHSAEALDSNRVSRKVSKCGYLFVAPDWDFTNPINRTKRWQRRWFVLYDDGELTYSVDEHPETVPQAIIDMTKVLEVSNAEDVTGNQYSIAITAPEKVHFIKGTSREESQWWFHELAIFPRSIKNSRYKRNATFPGGKATIVNKVGQLSTHAEEVAHFRSDSQLSRPRFFSCDAPPASQEKDSNVASPTNNGVNKAYEGFPEIEIIESSSNDQSTKSEDKPKASNVELATAKDSVLPSKGNEKVRSRHSMKRDQRLVSNTRSHSDSIGQMIPQSFEDTNKPLRRLKKNKGNSVHSANESLDIIILDKLKSKLHNELDDNPKSFSSRQQYHNDKNLEITKQTENNSTDDNFSGYTSYIKSSLDSNQNYYIPVPDNSERQHLHVKPLASEKDSKTVESVKTTSKPEPSTTNDENSFTHPVRGDPDGCGLDGINSHCSERELVQPAVSVKKGWLMLQDDKEEWSKRWFVLQKGALKFYSDLLAEENKKVEGFIMLTEIKGVQEAEASRNYGLTLQLKNGQKYMLSALTCGIRNNWIQAIQDTANLKPPANFGGENADKEAAVKVKCNTIHEEQTPAHVDSFSSPVSGMSSDDEFKTASETSVRTEDYFEWADEDADHASTSRALPPSPPLNRTPISRVKERARTRSSTRTVCEKGDKVRSDTHSSYGKDDVVKDDLSGSDRENCSFVNDAVDRRRLPGQKQQACRKVASDVPESMIVKSLESEVESLRSQLEQVQKNLHQRKVSNPVPKGEPSQPKTEKTLKDSKSEMIISNLQRKVSALENQITDLVKEIEKKNEDLIKKNDELVKLEEVQAELGSKMQKTESEAAVANSSKLEQEKCTRYLEERLAASESKITDLVSEMELFCHSHDSKAALLKDLLHEKEKENETLKANLEKLTKCCVSSDPSSESAQTASQLSPPSIDVSDTSRSKTHQGEILETSSSRMENDDLEKKLMRATNKIRSLRKELQEAHRTSDDMELKCFKLEQQMKSIENDFSSQLALMTMRIEDLTSKLSNAEKTNRQLKQKLARQEGKEQRRKSSLKGKEAFTVSKEMETKVVDLEKKLKTIERVLSMNSQLERSVATPPDGQVTTVTTSVTDSLQLLVRINSLESKVKDALDKLHVLKMPKVPESGNESVTEESRDALRALPNLDVLIDECCQMAEQHKKQCKCELSEGWQRVCTVLSTIKKELQSAALSPSTVDQQNVRLMLVKFWNLLQKRDFLWEDKLSLSKQFGSSSAKNVNGLWIEKILGNAIILGKMTCLMQQLNQTTRIMQLREARGCHRRMMLLEKKLLRLLKRKLDAEGVQMPKPDTLGLQHYVNETVMEMEKKEKSIEDLMEQYKAENLKLLANSLASKTLNRQMLNEDTKHADPQDTSSKTMSNLLSQKLMEAEIQQVFSRFSKFHENELLLDLEVNSSNSAKNEKHFEMTKKQLSADMSGSLKDIQQCYRVSLNEMQRGDIAKMDIGNVTSKLAEYVNLVAQNALVQGHLNYFRQSFTEPSGSLDDKEAAIETVPLIREVIEKEIETLYMEQELPLPKSVEVDLLDLPQSLTKHRAEPSLSRYTSVQDILQKSSDGKPSYFLSSYEARLQRSFRQRGQRSVTLPICTIDSTSTTTTTEKKACTNCQKLQEDVKAVKEKHAEALKEVEEKHESSLDALKTKFRAEIVDMKKGYEDEILNFNERNAALEKKQLLQKEEFDRELKALKESYEQEVVRKTDTKINEEAIRQRYQAEIEQLRGLCERGLIAMENSHRRIISELEEKHRHELEHLHVEKEQALAEETQATLAALDAMRKAHEAELQREIAKFKEEFLQKMHSNHEMDVMHKEHGEELEMIKEEILSLSEKYSIKCLENASLEERLDPIMQQLSNANTQIFNLTTRNKQLRAVLEQRGEEIQKELEMIKSTDSDNHLRSLQLQLQLKENQLLTKEEIVVELRHELQEVKNHKRELDEHCRLLDQSLKAERQLREDEVSTLRDRLEHFFLAGNLSFEDSSVYSSCSREDSASKCVTGSNKELQRVQGSFPESGGLMRSPSCPGLNNSDLFSPSIIRSRIRSVGSPARRFSTPLKI